MRTALTDDDLLNGGSTDRAGLAFTVVHAEIILKITTAIDPIETGPVMLDTSEQDGLNGRLEPGGLIQFYCI